MTAIKDLPAPSEPIMANRFEISGEYSTSDTKAMPFAHNIMGYYINKKINTLEIRYMATEQNYQALQFSNKWPNQISISVLDKSDKPIHNTILSVKEPTLEYGGDYNNSDVVILKFIFETKF